jgi:nondiscriminating glutamyl-tRNA synthetase
MNTQQKKPTVRFAPSPTGPLHIGGARSALYNYLFAKKHDAKLILRIEDTDKERSKKEYEENILEGFEWLGIAFDEMYRQSERTDVYVEHVRTLLNTGKAYVSNESSGERASVIRFKNPNTTVTFHDEIRGSITFDTTELGDFVIAKSETEPLYHTAVVVDDFVMGVTHVIRAEDHISNTPRQILILEALGAQRPLYAHIPLILAPDRSKMSKRHGAVAVTEYRAQGFLPEAMLNYLALLGWNPGGEQELFSLDELIGLFDLSRVQKGGAIFSLEKLRWFNREHLKRMPWERARDMLVEFLNNRGEVTEEFTALVRDSELFSRTLLERAEVFEDVAVFARDGEYDYLFQDTSINVTREDLLWKKEAVDATRRRIEHITALLDTATFKEPDTIKNAVWNYATEEGIGSVLSPFRIALSGKERSLDPFTIAAIIGKAETIRRLKKALDVL